MERCKRCGCYLREGSDGKRVRCDPCSEATRTETIKSAKSRAHPAKMIRVMGRHIVRSQQRKKMHRKAARVERQRERES